MLGLLARREHGASELKQKLKARGVAADDALPAIEAASADGRQSDQRYALMLARSRASKGYGPRYVTQELASKGVSRELVKLTLASEEIDWEQARAKASRSRDASPSKEALAKLKVKLARRGF